MKLGYNTNGFAHHRLEDAITILAEIGYRSVAITVDTHALNPYTRGDPDQKRRVKRLLEEHNLSCVIETGARFLLNPRHKHWPTLLDDAPMLRARRAGFLERCIELAADLRADAVSFWSGAKPDALSDAEAMDRLVEECRPLVKLAAYMNVRLAFEPEPGMFIDTMARFAELHDRVDHELFGLTLDVGHVHCLGDGDPCAHIRRWRDRLFNVHIEDMKRGVHDHLMFGEGDMDFPPILRTLREVNYPGGVHVELSRHSHDAVNTARKAYDFLQKSL